MMYFIVAMPAVRTTPCGEADSLTRPFDKEHRADICISSGRLEQHLRLFREAVQKTYFDNMAQSDDKIPC